MDQSPIGCGLPLFDQFQTYFPHADGIYVGIFLFGLADELADAFLFACFYLGDNFGIGLKQFAAEIHKRRLVDLLDAQAFDGFGG